MLRWDDLRVFLAIARAGTLGGAAQHLGVDHSTVLRRLQTIEEALCGELFQRDGSPRRLTAAGRDLLPLAEQVEADVRAIELQMAARDQHRSGTIKLALPDGLAVTLMPALVRDFHRANPGIRVEITTSNVPLSLAAREADIELRPTRDPALGAKGRRIGRIAFGVYASQSYLAARPVPKPRARTEDGLAEHDWILPDLAALPIYAPAEWMSGIVPPGRIIATASSAVVMTAMVRQGLGISTLPCYLADPEPALRRLLLLKESLWGELWLLTHPELSRVPRIRAFLDHATRAITRSRAALEGRREVVSGAVEG